MKGITFTDLMNEARRDGRKSMTRRIKTSDKPPYKVGEVLYVREKHRFLGWEFGENDVLAMVIFSPEGQAHPFWITAADRVKILARKKPNAWLSGRYMLASFARDYIKITGIRSERLQDIFESDADLEGVEIGDNGLFKNYITGEFEFLSASISFKSLWQLIHGAESWKENPEVWVIEFEETLKPN